MSNQIKLTIGGNSYVVDSGTQIKLETVDATPPGHPAPVFTAAPASIQAGASASL